MKLPKDLTDADVAEIAMRCRGELISKFGPRRWDAFVSYDPPVLMDIVKVIFRALRAKLEEESIGRHN